MEKIWGGRFLPLAKHRLGTGDLYNHLEITEWEVETVDEDEKEDDRKYIAHVTVGFIESGGEIYYEYEYEVDSPDYEPTLEEVLEHTNA